MLVSIEGIYRNGVVELAETPTHIQQNARVIVTFIEIGQVDLQARGIDERQAAELRAQLESFAEDWESPEMSVYDNYDLAKTNLQAR